MRQFSSPHPEQPHKCCSFLNSKESYGNRPEFKYYSRSFIREFAFFQCYTWWDRPPTEDTHGGSNSPTKLENRYITYFKPLCRSTLPKTFLLSEQLLIILGKPFLSLTTLVVRKVVVGFPLQFIFSAI